MLSQFDRYQQVLITALWALSDAQPPRKGELRREFSLKESHVAPHSRSVRRAWRNAPMRDGLALLASRNQEHFLAALSGALADLSRVSDKYPRYTRDWNHRGPGVPGASRRQIRARKSA